MGLRHSALTEGFRPRVDTSTFGDMIEVEWSYAGSLSPCSDHQSSIQGYSILDYVTLVYQLVGSYLFLETREDCGRIPE